MWLLKHCTKTTQTERCMKAFQDKTLPADRPTGLDPLPHTIGRFPAATQEGYQYDSENNICAHTAQLSSVGWECKATELAASVVTHPEQAAAAIRDARLMVMIEGPGPEHLWHSSLPGNEWKPTLDFWRRSSLVTSPVESRWGQASCSAIISFYSRGPLRIDREWWQNCDGSMSMMKQQLAW